MRTALLNRRKQSERSRKVSVLSVVSCSTTTNI